jgi:hypothetical protein
MLTNIELALIFFYNFSFFDEYYSYSIKIKNPTKSLIDVKFELLPGSNPLPV